MESSKLQSEALLSGDLKDLSNYVQEIHQALHQKITNAQTKIEKSSQDSLFLLKDMEFLEEELGAERSKIQTLSESIELSRHGLEQQREELEKAYREIAHLYQELKTERSGTKSALQSQALVAELQDAKKILVGRVQSLEQVVIQYQEKIQSQNQSLDELEKELNQAKQEVVAAKNESAKIQTHSSQMIANQEEQHRVVIASLRAEHQKHQDWLESYLKSWRISWEPQQGFESLNLALSSKLTSFRDRVLAQAKEAISKNRAELKYQVKIGSDLAEQNQALKDEVQKLTSAVLAEQKALAAARIEAEKANQGWLYEQQSRAAMVQKNEQLRSELLTAQETRKRFIEKEARLKAIEDMLQTATEASREAEKRTKTLQEEQELGTQRERTLRLEVQNLRDQLSKKISEVDNLKTENQNQNQRNKTLLEDLALLKRALDELRAASANDALPGGSLHELRAEADLWSQCWVNFSHELNDLQSYLQHEVDQTMQVLDGAGPTFIKEQNEKLIQIQKMKVENENLRKASGVREQQSHYYMNFINQGKKQLREVGLFLEEELRMAQKSSPLTDLFELTEKEIERLDLILKKTPASSPERTFLEKMLTEAYEQRSVVRKIIARNQQDVETRISRIQAVFSSGLLDMIPPIPPSGR